MWVKIKCIRYDKLAKQNVSRVSRGKALLARHSQKSTVTICHDSSHSSHMLSTRFTSWEGFSRATHENFFDLQFALSLRTLSHTQPLQWNPTWNIGYKRLNKITIKFGTKLKPTQNSCKSQLYSLSLWLFCDKTLKTYSGLKHEFGNNGKTHSYLIWKLWSTCMYIM